MALLADGTVVVRPHGHLTLIEFVARRRASQSWRAIAEEIEEITGIWVSDDSLRRWFADRIQVEVKVA
jgi:hypothetical protein